jgi:hypothetical protein
LTKKVFELAKELDIGPLELVESLKSYGFQVRNHLAELSDEDVAKYLLNIEYDAEGKILKTAPSDETQIPISLIVNPEDLPKTFIIAGVKYTNRDGVLRSEILKSCKKGQVLTLERDPRNKYDANAILILNGQGEDLGFVPKEIAKTLAPQIDLGQIFKVSLVDIQNFYAEIECSDISGFKSADQDVEVALAPAKKSSAEKKKATVICRKTDDEDENQEYEGGDFSEPYNDNDEIEDPWNYDEDGELIYPDGYPD